ncbi:MAG: TonB-dependent receptor, partial [Acidiferrobacterales bacterium]
MGIKPTNKLSPLVAAITAVLYPSQPALAQDAEESALEEVIVTATHRELSLQEVPQSITAFTTMDIERNNLQNLEDLVRALPSLGLINSQPGRNDLVYRGVSSGSQEFYTDSQVAVYLDETPMAAISQQPFPRMIDIERVESLPGPQGTLFGSASQSGTLRIITNKPNMDGYSGQFFGALSTTRGGEQSYEANGWINIPMGDSFAIRAVGYYVKEGGYIDNVLAKTFVDPVPGGPQFDNTNAAVVEDDFNDYELTGGRISALWNITDKWSATLAIISESSKNDGAWESDPSLGDFKVARFFDEFRDDEWTSYGLTIQGDLGFAALTSNTSFFDRKIVYEWDNMYYEQWKDSYYGYYYGYALYNTQYTFGTIFNDQNQSRFSQEIRLASQSESRFQWMIGAYYEDLQDDWYYGADNPQLMETIGWEYAQYLAYYYSYYGYDVAYPLPATTVGYSNRLDRQVKQTSIFSEISFDLTDKWTVTGGARWFEYDRYDFKQNQFPEGLAPLGSLDTNGIYVSEGKPSDTLLKFSTQYQIDDTKMVYFLYSQGFRLGGTNSQRAANTGQVPLEYGPDTLDNYEIGLKSQWLDDRLLVNATFFLMQWDDYQQSSSSGIGPWWLRGTFNAADAEIMGLELNGTALFTDNFSFTYSLLWSDPEWTTDFTFPDGDMIEKGMTLPTSPEWKAFAALNWTFPGALGTEEVFLRYDYSYQSETWNTLQSIMDNNPEGIIDAWNVSNLQVGARLKNDWTVTFVLRNLFDQKAIATLYNGANYASDWFGTDFNRNKRVYNRPRTFGIQIRKS